MFVPSCGLLPKNYNPTAKKIVRVCFPEMIFSHGGPPIVFGMFTRGYPHQYSISVPLYHHLTLIHRGYAKLQDVSTG
jgi:hypothetical protein